MLSMRDIRLADLYWINTDNKTVEQVKEEIDIAWENAIQDQITKAKSYL